jgi:protein-arginine kinase activator protein McsA
MKQIFILGLLLILNNTCYSQSNYFSLSTEKLTQLKTEAVKNADYVKAADLKKVLDQRQEEEAKILSLKADIDKKVKSEDFQGAGILQEELKKLTETKKRKEELRTEIAKATAEENYGKAAAALKELRLLEGLDEPVVAVKPKSEPVLVTYKEPEKTSSGRQHKTLLAYSPGTYTPFGVMVGMISQKGINLVGAIRLSRNQFVTLDDAVLENGAIDDKSASWHYTDYAYYSYASYSLGISFKVFGDINTISGHFIPTLGLARYRYMYEFDKTDSYTMTSNVLDKDQSGYNFNVSPNFLLNMKFFNLHMGAEIGIPDVRQSNFVFGAGFAF